MSEQHQVSITIVPPPPTGYTQVPAPAPMNFSMRPLRGCSPRLGDTVSRVVVCSGGAQTVLWREQLVRLCPANALIVRSLAEVLLIGRDPVLVDVRIVPSRKAGSVLVLDTSQRGTTPNLQRLISVSVSLLFSLPFLYQPWRLSRLA